MTDEDACIDIRREWDREKSGLESPLRFQSYSSVFVHSAFQSSSSDCPWRDETNWMTTPHVSWKHSNHNNKKSLETKLLILFQPSNIHHSAVVLVAFVLRWHFWFFFFQILQFMYARSDVEQESKQFHWMIAIDSKNNFDKSERLFVNFHHQMCCTVYMLKVWCSKSEKRKSNFVVLAQRRILK